MAASITDKISDTRNAARPNSARVTSGRSTGGTTLACDNLAGWPTASKIHFVTYSIDSNSALVAGTQLDCYGIVSGNNIGSFTVVDGTDTGNVVGDVVEMLPTAAWGQDLADALTSTHNRSGGLKTGITLTQPTVADFTNATHTHATNALGGQLTATAFANNAITAPLLATNAINLASVSSSTSQGAISSSFVIVTGLTSTVTVPAGGRTVRIEGFVPLVSSSAICTISLGIYNAATVTGSAIQTSTTLFAVAGATGTSAYVMHEYVPVAGSQSYCLAVKVDTGTGSTTLSATQLAYLSVKIV